MSSKQNKDVNPRFVRGATLSVVDRAIMSLASFLVGIFAAKALSPADYGYFVLLWTTVLVVHGWQNALILGPMRICAVLENPEQELASIRQQALVQLVFAFGTAIVAAVILFVYSGSVGLAIAYGTCLVLFQIQEFARTTFLMTGSMRKLMWIDTLSQIIRVGLLVCGYLYQLITVVWIFVINAISSAAGTVAVAKIVCEPGPYSMIRTIRANWDFGRWLLLESVVFTLSIQVYMYMVAYWLGPEEAAGVGAVQNLVNVFNVLQIGLISYSTPYARRLIVSNDILRWKRLLVGVAGVMFFLITVGAIILSVYSQELLSVLYNAHYKKYAPLVPLLAAAYCLNGLNAVLNMAFRTLEQPQVGLVAKVVSAIASLLLGYPLLSRYGVIGCGIGLLLVQVIWLGVYLNSLSKMQLPSSDYS